MKQGKYTLIGHRLAAVWQQDRLPSPQDFGKYYEKIKR
jgi:hypothetical protein